MLHTFSVIIERKNFLCSSLLLNYYTPLQNTHLPFQNIQLATTIQTFHNPRAINSNKPKSEIFKRLI